jgi:hypothetical protein
VLVVNSSRTLSHRAGQQLQRETLAQGPSAHKSGFSMSIAEHVTNRCQPATCVVPQ